VVLTLRVISISFILRVIDRIGYKGRMTGHGFRSVASTVLNELGLFDFDVKELMGHSTIKMTERYAHLAPEHKASAVEKIVS